MRRIIALLLLIAMLSLTACGKASSAAEASLSADEQRGVLEANRSLWAFDEGEYAPDWYYTFTDLDHNGLMEVISASTQGSGIFSYARFYEVLPDGSGVRNLYHADVEIEGPDDWPEVILESIPCYYDCTEDRYYYVCSNDVRDGAAHAMTQLAALCLKDGVAEWEYLVSMEVQWTESGEHFSYMDSAGNPISEEEYDSAVARRFAGMELSELQLGWIAVTPYAAAAASEDVRQDGERFDAVIMLEGMEETVHYEHIRNDAIGFEMDYDYESFVRSSESDRECIISIYDRPEDPWNYLEVKYVANNADTVSVSVREALSGEYDTIAEWISLDGVGGCTRIDASNAKNNGGTPDQLQAVYIIPAGEGCLVATAHYTFESAEGFGRRFSYMLNTLTVIDR